jgi:hypothetical protein
MLVIPMEAANGGKFNSFHQTTQHKIYHLLHSYSGSDGTTREESNVQKGSGYEAGNANQGSSYWITPEGQRITITWVADENGYRAVGDHLPTPPPIPKEIAEMLASLPKEPSYKKYP